MNSVKGQRGSPREGENGSARGEGVRVRVRCARVVYGGVVHRNGCAHTRIRLGARLLHARSRRRLEKKRAALWPARASLGGREPYCSLANGRPGSHGEKGRGIRAW